MIKFYDTSALLDFYPEIMKKEEHFYVALTTIKELENIKTSGLKDYAIKYRARRLLRALHENSSHYSIKAFGKEQIDDAINKRDLPHNNDNCIVATAYLVSLIENIEFITGDLSCYFIAKKFFTLPATFKNPNLEQVVNGGIINVQLNSKEFPYPSVDSFIQAMNESTTPNPYNLHINQYLSVYDEDGEGMESIRWDGENYQYVQPYIIKNDFTGKTAPRNMQQEVLFDLLQNRKIPVKAALGVFGSGKAISTDTKIPTPDGWRTAKDIQIGDFLYDRQGNPTKVLGVFPQGKIDAYKLYFSDGRTAICNDEHIWACYTSKKNLKNFTVREMLDLGIKNNSGSYRFKIPHCEPVKYPKKDFLIDPYVIGVFLGDGACLERPLTISSQDESIVAEVANLIGAKQYCRNSDNNYNWHFILPEDLEKGPRNAIKFQTKAFFQFLKEKEGIMNYSYNKFIPSEYKLGSVEQRYALLQGLMDTDGTIDNTDRGRTSFFTTSLRLANDVVEIAHSLGLLASISEDKREWKYTTGNSYIVAIGCERKEKHKLFRLPRKKNQAKSLVSSSRTTNLVIRHIEKLPEQKEMVCFYVDNSEHLFLINDYLVTHNTFLMLAHALDFVRHGEFDGIVFVRNNIIVKNTVELGALPGTLNEKLGDFAAPIADHIGGHFALDEMLENGTIELLHLGFARGRDIKNKIIFCDEAENLTREHVQLLLGRVSEGSEIWFAGDLRQVDGKVFEDNNGLRALVANLSGNPLFGTVKLTKSERGEVSATADLLDV